MKKQLIVLLLLWYSIWLAAQNNAITQAMKNYDFEQAISLISKEKQTQNLDLLKARCYKNLYKYNEACIILEEYLKNDNSDLSAINELADCYQLAGNYQRSKFFYFMALQALPESQYCQINYLLSLYRLKEWTEVTKLANHIFAKDSVTALFPVVGDSYVQLQKNDSAIFYYQKAIDVNHQDYNTLTKLTKLYWQKGNSDEMVNLTNSYIKTDSTNQQINQMNGIGQCLKKEYDKAIYRLQNLAEKGDKSFYTNFYLGTCYFAKSDYIEAYDYFSKANEADSTNQHLYYYFGKSAALSGHPEKAIRLLNKGLEAMTPKDSTVYNYHFTLSNVYEQQGAYAKQIGSLKACRQALPASKMILYRIGRVYDWNLKDYEKALEFYKEFMATRSANQANTTQEAAVSYYVVAENRIKEVLIEIDKKKNSLMHK